MSGDLKDMRAYSRGYEDGRRSKDADHAAVAIRLSNLRFDGGSHENLSKIAHAIYPFATGWTCESSKGLRDRLIDLLGGVHDHCDSGRGCACGDSRAGGYDEHAEAMTYDVLGNERHKAVCELRHIRDCLRGDSTCNSMNIADAIGVKLNVGDRLHESICDRLIYLLGGDQPTSGTVWKAWGREWQDRVSKASAESDDQPTLRDLYGIWRDAPDSQESPILANSDRGDGGKVTITAEFREAIETATKTYKGSWYEMDDADHTICHITEGELLGIADRIDANFNQAMISRSSELGCYKLHINQLEAERYELQAKLEEADAAIANYRERMKSLDESERLRDELKTKLDAIREALDGRG